jgi:hypothetical protein
MAPRPVISTGISRPVELVASLSNSLGAETERGSAFRAGQGDEKKQDNKDKSKRQDGLVHSPSLRTIAQASRGAGCV